MTPQIVDYIEKRISDKLSPEQVSNTMRQEIGTRVCHERIYQHIAQNKDSGGTLYTHLRINYKRRYRRRNRGKGIPRHKIPNRVDINQRPAEVEFRHEVGHWEAGLVHIAHGYLVTIAERAKRYSLIGWVPKKTADLVSAEMERLLTPYSDQVLSLTYDNGPEFAQHEKVNKALGCNSYFAKPYHSWERGTNENTNGLIRQYYPKQARGEKISSDKPEYVHNALNTRPRKMLGWKSPMEEFASPFNFCIIALGT